MRTLPEQILKAVETTPRHEFIGDFRLSGSPVVYTSTDPQYFDRIYSAVPLVYAGHEGATNSDPSFILHLVNLLDIHPENRVLEIGSGTGWLSAIMARLAGSVAGMEISGALVAQAQAAKERLQIANVFYAEGSVLDTAIDGTFDRIVFTASTFALPESVFDALEIGGIIGLPIRHRSLSDGYFFLRKESAESAQSFVSRLCKFVPIQGEANDNTGAHALPQAARLLLESPPVATALLILLKDKQEFCTLAGLESFLSKMHPERFRVFDLSLGAQPRNIAWRPGARLQYAFGLYDGESLSLWRNNEIQSHGPNAGALQEELLAACNRWRTLRRPTDIDCSLEIIRTQDEASGAFEERRGAFLYRWSYGKQ